MLLFVLLVGACVPVFAGPEGEAQKSTAELKELLEKIQKIKTEIGQYRGESEKLRKQLEQSEAEIEQALRESRKLDEKIRKQKETLERLKQKEKQKSQAFLRHKDFLKAQILSVWTNQSLQPFKKVVTQEDPLQFSRNLVYHRYFAAARAKKMAQIGHEIDEIQTIKKAIRQQTEQLRIAQESQKDKLQKLEKKKQQRQLIIARLDQGLSSRMKKLHQMERDAEKLNHLIHSLKKEAARLALLDKLEKARKTGSVFARLKGKLRWPATGTLAHRYGTTRNGSSLTWKGVLIDAPVGSSVRAVSDGRVIFSDWFRNLGRLIIIDHGDGYMTLYGHNQELFRSVGDKVKAGEIIASVGDTGGRKNSGLYFEVRHKGTPVNPAIWCKGFYK